MNTMMFAGGAATPIDDGQLPDLMPRALPEMDTWLDQYHLKVVQRVGRGSVIVRAIEPTLRLEVALKLLNNGHRRHDLSALTAALRVEAAVLAQIHHPNVLRIWGIGTDPFGLPYLASEYVGGRNLLEIIRVNGHLDFDAFCHVARSLVSALAELERLGIVHRDIKPENVLTTAAGAVRLIDFGLALVLPESLLPAIDAAFPANMILGTPAYMAPEQARSSTPIDTRCDQYALGVTLYHALTGRLPFRANTPAQWLLRHIEEVPIEPHRVAPGVPIAVSLWVMRLLQKRPADRFADAAAMALGLVQARREGCAELGVSPRSPLSSADF